jgi:hypothetical protein
MPEHDLVVLFAHPLDRLGIPYMVSGSVAAMLFGEPRLTHDIDIVVFLTDAAIAALPTVFAEPEFYLPPRDVIVVETRRDLRGHFNVIHVPSGLKADFYPDNGDALHQWALARALRLPLSSGNVTVAPPEYVIVRKLEYYREGGSEKHFNDVRAMLELSGDQIDRAALQAWVERLGLTAQWAAVAGAGS